VEQPVSAVAKIVKMENDINLDKNISNSSTKLPEIRLGEQFVVQSLRVVELHYGLFRGRSFEPGESCNTQPPSTGP